MSRQIINEERYHEITVHDETRGRLLTITFRNDGKVATISGGRLMLELGNGERVLIDDPLRLIDEIYSRGHFDGLEEKAAE